MMQETYFSENIHLKLHTEFESDIYLSNGWTYSRCVAIWIKKTINYNFKDEFKDTVGRLIMLNIEIDDNLVTLINVYAPNNAKK